MKTSRNKYVLREVTIILGLSIFLSIVYNAFSGNGISLIRIKPKKNMASDSVLFPQLIRVDTTGYMVQQYTAIPKDIKVIAPLHERALANPDSMEKLYSQKHEQVFKIISLLQLTRLLGEKHGVIFDARGAEEYKKGHIKGARNIPGLDVGQHFEKLVVVPRDTLVIIYCNNSECHLGRILADFMSAMEFKNIYLYDDGWDGWIKANMPIDTTVSG